MFHQSMVGWIVKVEKSKDNIRYFWGDEVFLLFINYLLHGTNKRKSKMY